MNYITVKLQEKYIKFSFGCDTFALMLCFVHSCDEKVGEKLCIFFFKEKIIPNK